jgi:hypothetical protein
MHELITNAIKKHEISIEEYDEIIAVALQDNIIAAQEKILLAQLQDLIEDKTIKILPE